MTRRFGPGNVSEIVLNRPFCRGIAIFAMASLWVLSSAQGQITLPEALKAAREKNGTVRAAYQDVIAARSRADQRLAQFLPSITPNLNYTSSRREIDANRAPRFIQTEGLSTEIQSSWRILDSGERTFALNAARRNTEVAEANAVQTLRRTLFNVHSQYYEALRSQELLRVAKFSEDRTKLILDQTTARVEVRASAPIDVLQANADYQNARVQSIAAQNQTVSTVNTLKATIGWGEAPLPELAKADSPSNFATFGDAQARSEYIKRGLRDRRDLVASRKSLQAQRSNTLLAERQSQLSASLDANFDLQLTPKTLESRAFTLNLSFPLFDGGERRAAFREAKANYEASKSELVQSERAAEAEIDSAMQEYELNVQRLEAANIALDAARKNYEAAVESQRLGVYNIIQVSTAQVSLVTAESNSIEATYDYYISEVRLRLVTGQAIPGETTQ